MSIFFPYSPTVVLSYLSTLFNIDISGLSASDTLVITLISNLYFYVYWFVIIYFSLKIFNRIWERLF